MLIVVICIGWLVAAYFKDRFGKVSEGSGVKIEEAR
jgi:hypothetical protein